MITGGDSEISQAVAFAQEGADVAIVYLQEHSDAEKTKHLVEKAGRKYLLIADNLGRESFCKSSVHTTLEHFGHLDILVNNAAEQHPQDSLKEISEKRLEKTFQTNIFAYFFMHKAALEELRSYH